MPIFTTISHDAFVADIGVLAAAIRADPDWRPDRLVGIGRGGLVPAVYLSHATGVPMVSCDWSSGVDAFAQEVLDRIAARARAGERLLLVDDINDSGLTIGALRAALAGAPSGTIRIATLIDTSASAQRVDYRARTIDRAVTKDWFVFPWESLAPETAVASDAAAVPGRIGGSGR